jgi:hypothetical protein
MAQPLNSYRERAQRNLLRLAATGAVLALCYAVIESAPFSVAFFTGWILLCAVVLTALYNVRKRISVWPVGSAAAWLQLHAYTGAFAVFAFLLHTGAALPNGWLETVLWATFVLVAFSGIIGLYWSRVMPQRLARNGIEVLFERIPAFIYALREEVEQCVTESARVTGSSLLGDHYREELAGWFNGPAEMWSHFRGAGHNSRVRRLNKIDALARYASAAERPYQEQLRELTERKMQLDEHYALQLALKLWLFIHVPLTTTLLLLAVAHLVTAYAFSGGI